MLDAYIIDRLKQRKKQEQERRPVAPLMPHPFPEVPPIPPSKKNCPDRGGVIIDYTVG